MILRNIRVQGWRCFADPIGVGPLGEGLNVVHGPNGSGKSTLLWALARGLFDSYKVSGADIESLRPWGRQLLPRVEIEFSHDGIEYRLQKQFLGSQQAKLDRLENGAFVALAEATQADDQIRQLLAAESPKRGVTNPGHWGFAQVLWATQGALHIENLSDGTRNSIHDSLGAQIAGPGGEEIGRRVEKLYSSIFTPTGKLKGGANAPRLTNLQQELGSGRERRATLAGRLTDFDNASRRIEDLRNEQAQAEQKAIALEEDVQKAAQLAKQFDSLSAECKILAEKEKNARNTYDQLKAQFQQIKNLTERQRLKQATLQELKAKAPPLEEQWLKCQKEVEDAKGALKLLREQRAVVERNEAAATRAKKFTDAMIDLQRAQRQVAQVEEASEQGASLGKQVAEFVAPDSATLAKIRKAARRRDDARLRLEAALIKVTITPITRLEIDIQQAEQTGNQALADGEVFTMEGAPEVAFEIADVAKVHASGPTESADKLRKELHQAASELDDLTAGFGTQDLAQLETRSEQARALASDLREAETRLETLLGETTLAELNGEFSNS